MSITGCSSKADNMGYWWCIYPRTESRCQPQYCLWFAAWLPSCVLVQQCQKCWQLSVTSTTTTLQDIGCGQHCRQPANCYLFVYSSWTTLQSLPVLDWQLAETLVCISFKTMQRLGFFTACWLQNNCTVSSMYVTLTLLSSFGVLETQVLVFLRHL